MKERWDLNRRAVRLLCHLDRKYFLCTLFSSLTTAIAPYIPIYFSAKIIDALTAGAGGKTLALYAALTVGLTALIGLAGALLKMHADVGEAELDRLVDWKHAEKAMDLPYALIEDRKTALLRERIEMETQTGYNVYYYAVTAGGLVRYAVQIAAAEIDGGSTGHIRQQLAEQAAGAAFRRDERSLRGREPGNDLHRLIHASVPSQARCSPTRGRSGPPCRAGRRRRPPGPASALSWDGAA